MNDRTVHAEKLYKFSVPTFHSRDGTLNKSCVSCFNGRNLIHRTTREQQAKMADETITWSATVLLLRMCAKYRKL